MNRRCMPFWPVSRLRYAFAASFPLRHLLQWCTMCISRHVLVVSHWRGQQQLLRPGSHLGGLRGAAPCPGRHRFATGHPPAHAFANFTFIALRSDLSDVTDCSGVWHHRLMRGLQEKRVTHYSLMWISPECKVENKGVKVTPSME